MWFFPSTFLFSLRSLGRIGPRWGVMYSNNWYLVLLASTYSTAGRQGSGTGMDLDMEK